MDDRKRKEIRKNVKEEYRSGRARLFRVENESQVRSEIARDRDDFFAFFKQQGIKEELELTQRLARLLMNFSKLASYRGVLEGYNIFSLGLELGEDRARFYIFEYLQTHPEAKNQELVRFLDRKNGRLQELRTRGDDPLWATLPQKWRDALKRKKLDCITGEYWETALRELPTLVMPYLSRAKGMAKDAKTKNVLYNWPEIIKQHKKRRKEIRRQTIETE